MQRLQEGSTAGFSNDNLRSSEVVVDDACGEAVFSRDKPIEPHFIRSYNRSLHQPAMVSMICLRIDALVMVVNVYLVIPSN